VLVGRQSVILAGEDQLLEDLKGVHAEWDALGRRSATAYEVLIGFEPEPGDLAVDGVLQRRLFRPVS